MTKPQITLEEALILVSFEQSKSGSWRVKNVWGDVENHVHGKINNRKWVFIETRKERFLRMLKETGDTQLIKAFNQLNEDS